MKKNQRQQAILRELRKEGGKGLLRENIKNRFDEQGVHSCTDRSLQRYLKVLSERKAVRKEKEGRSWRYFYLGDGEELCSDESQFWSITRVLPDSLYPPGVKKFVEAKQKKILPDHRSLEEKFCFIPDFSPASSEVFSEIGEALFIEKCECFKDAIMEDGLVKVAYQSTEGRTPKKEWIFEPKALIQRGKILYVVGYRKAESQILCLRVRRFTKVAKIDYEDALKEVPDLPKKREFSLSSYLLAGDLPFSATDGIPQLIKLRLKLKNRLPSLFEELKPGQDFQALGMGGDEITTYVYDTSFTRYWLQSYGSEIEVLEPADLRKWIAQKARECWDQYKDSFHEES